MTRRGFAALAALGALGAACSGTTNTGVIELNLDRPVDVSFACYGLMKLANGQFASAHTAMPTAVCERLSPQQTPRPDGAPISPMPYPGQVAIPSKDGDPEPPDWYGFILQSASGTVALTTWPARPADSLFVDGASAQQVSDIPTSVFRVLDADPLTPGKNAISIGEDPIAIVTDKTGCFEVTANAGSCDLSELDITSTLANIVDGNPVRPRIDRVTVTGPNGPILARPAAMVAEPFLDVAPGTDTPGNACPAAATSKVYIAYPSCHLVAEVELKPGSNGMASATVIGGIKYDSTGTPSVLTDQTLAAALDCPVECGSPGATVGSSQEGVRPVALDYRLDTQTNTVKQQVTSRLAIGLDTGGAPLAAPITVVDLQLSGGTAFAPVAGTILSIPLEISGGLVGVSAVALSPQMGMGSNTGNGTLNDNVDDQGQYVYAVAADGTVRVADVLKLKRECDTQIDGRFLHGASATELECLPLGAPNRPRRPAARGPGIELPSGEVANSVAIVKGLTTAPLIVDDANKTKIPVIPMPEQPSMLLGYFAVITSPSGNIYLANVNDDAVPHDIDSTSSGRVLETAPVRVMPHQLRDSLSNRERLPPDCVVTDPTTLAATATAVAQPGGASVGGPRLTAPALQQSVPGTLIDDVRFQLPRLQQIECAVSVASGVPVSPLEFGAPEVRARPEDGPAASRQIAYPELKDVVSESWTLTYEGLLQSDNTANAINGSTVRTGQTFVDRTGMFIRDAARPFCAMGAEVGDIVEFRGCNPANLDRDCPSGYTCYVHPLSNIGTGACFLKSEAPRLRDVCRDFLSSVRRYTVGADSNGGTAPDKLVLWQRKHELSTTPVDGCVSDDQCDDLARAALVLNPSADPFVEPAAGAPAAPRPTHWSCMADPLRKPIPGADATRNKRCVQRCTYTPRTAGNDNINAQAPFCTSGTICLPDGDPQAIGPGSCMEGIEPPQACLNGPQRYGVRAGEAFTVIGNVSGFVHPIIASSSDGDRCVVDPNLARNPLSIGRIPLNPPACQNPPPADPDYPFTGRTGPSTFEANPCLLTVPHFEVDQVYPPATAGGFGSCRTPVAKASTPESPQPHPHPISAIKYRNRSLTLTIVDPYREAALTCLGRDPIDTQTQAPIPSNIPLVIPGYQIGFAVKAGFAPATVVIGSQVSPVKVVHGPSESIWVIDDGDGFTDVSTRGEVYRIESVPPASSSGGAGTIINALR